MFVLALLSLAFALEDPTASVTATLPQNFNWYQQQPRCIFTPYDSGRCMNYHAFAVTAALQSRFCIKYPAYAEVFSPQYLVSCNARVAGCAGQTSHYDHMYDLDFIALNGIPNAQCVPYQSSAGGVPACPGYCTNGSPVLPGNVRRFGQRYSLQNTDQIMQDIYSYGPMVAYFEVDTSFATKFTGVHHYNPAFRAGGMFLSIIGWGYSTTDGWYFVCQNNAWANKVGSYDRGIVFMAMADGGIDPQSIAASRPL